ncbi:BTAD domain-containing putative transcriptional regulator [Nocardia rhizosphaerae]|uniref:BTAD domain-containing putative transcriptional regulator n=1 Tax=Nocardia rhizosphaerae TaxID=1691571 RepID=A0ABV8L5M1_9NOCA
MSAQHLGSGAPPSDARAACSRVLVGVLGAIAIRRDGVLRPLPGAKARLLLTALTVRQGRARGAQALIDEVWGDQPPRAPMNALHTQVSRLRAALPDGALEIGPAGYRLSLPADSVDLSAATALAAAAATRLAAHDPSASLTAVAAARAMWRGEPAADLPDSVPADDLRSAADQLRRDLDHVELAAHLAMGELTAALPLARTTATAQPFDEPAHTTLIRLLARSGRTNEALEVFATYRLRLIAEFGADPGPALLALNAAILRGEPVDLPGFGGAVAANGEPAQAPPHTGSTFRGERLRDTAPRTRPHPAGGDPSPHPTAPALGVAPPPADGDRLPRSSEVPGVDGSPRAAPRPEAAAADGSRGRAADAPLPDPAGDSPSPGSVVPGAETPDSAGAGAQQGRSGPQSATTDHRPPTDDSGRAVSPGTAPLPGREGDRPWPDPPGGELPSQAAGAGTQARVGGPREPAGTADHRSPRDGSAWPGRGGAVAPGPAWIGTTNSPLDDSRRVGASGSASPGDDHASDRPQVPTALGLRAAPNELLGRADDLSAIAELIGRSRVTTVLGPGGTGKTRVAHAIGAEFAGSVPVVLVELASVRPATGSAAVDLAAAIAQVLGVGEVIRDPASLRPGRSLDAGRRLRETLSARPTLLILDNCEHVIDAAAELVAELIGSCPQLTVLTTSRSPLTITAESVYPLPPLPVDAAGSPATELFSARARAVRPDVHLDPESVARLCRAIDGLPLAIELAAARVRTMSVAEIETRLVRRFALLRSGDRAAPQRHRTLHAVIAWSWNLLEPDQQVALRRLSRFPAGFTLRAAEVVAAGPEVVEVAGAVDGLVAQSLLGVLDDPDSGGIRYRMLETVREFGAEQLAVADAGSDGGESALIEDRMACWAREFALSATRTYRAGDQVPAVHAVSVELDNLVAILRDTADRGDAATAYTVFPAVAMVWMMRGAHLEFTGWAPRLVALLPPEPRTGDEADLQLIAYALTCLNMMFAGTDDADPRLIGRVRTRVRRLCAHPGLDPGLRLLGLLITVRPTGFRIGRLLAVGAHSPDSRVRVAATAARANIWENAGNVHGSTRDAMRCLADLDPVEVWGTALVCQHLGQLCSQSARYADAVGHFRRALEPMVRLRMHDEIMESRCYLASALIGSGHREQARAELAFALRRDDAGIALVDDPAIRRNHRIATVANAVAELELADGDIDAGLRHYRRALDLLGWPDFDPAPGPGGLMLTAAAASAHVLHGRAVAATDLIAHLVGRAEAQLAQFYDLPQIGAVGCAVGSYLLATGFRDRDGLELLLLAGITEARQDGPSMALARHLALHRDAVGADTVTAVTSAVTGTRRLAAARRIIDLVADLDDNGIRP